MAADHTLGAIGEQEDLCSSYVVEARWEASLLAAY